MLATSWLTYLAHYVIARTVYDAARGAGVPPLVLVLGAIVFLVVLHRGRRRWRHRS